MSKTIIISEPETKWALKVSNYLKEKGFQTEITSNGKDCEFKVFQRSIDICLLDIQTQNISSLDLLHFLRFHSPKTKIIFSFKDKQQVKDLKLSTLNLHKKMGVSEVLVKPYSLEQLYHVIETKVTKESEHFLKAMKDPAGKGEHALRDEDFTKIPIEDFFSENAAVFDCFIKLKANKYVKVLHQGDFFRETRVKKYLEQKQIKNFYFKTKDKHNYFAFLRQLKSQLHQLAPHVQDSSNREKSKSFDTLVRLFSTSLNTHFLTEVLAKFQNKLNFINRNSSLKHLLTMYQAMDEKGYAHLELVCFLSLSLCQHLKWNTQRTEDLIALGSLLHDIGKLKLPENMRRKNSHTLTQEDFEFYKEHCEKGSVLLQQFSIISEPVRQIVYQHHEYIDGSGFPNGLSDYTIFPLAKVVALSNAFAHEIQKNKKPPHELMQVFVSEPKNINRFDPECMKALIYCFKKN